MRVTKQKCLSQFYIIGSDRTYFHFAIPTFEIMQLPFSPFSSISTFYIKGFNFQEVKKELRRSQGFSRLCHNASTPS